MKEEIRHIANNIELKENSPVILQFWISDSSEYITKIFEEALINRGYKVYSVIMNETNIKGRIKKRELIPEKLFGEDWINIKNIIDIYEFSPTGLVKQFEAETLIYFKQYMRSVFEKFTHEDNTFLQISIPSEENIEKSGLTLEEYTRQWKSLVFVNYERLKFLANFMIEEYKNFKKFKIITADKNNQNYFLEISIENRQWYKDTGNGDFPAGEIYIAPVENSVTGSFVASKVTWDLETIDEVVLEFKEGKLVNSSVESIKQDLEQAPGDSLTMGEFGIGLNHQLKGLTGYRLFDEKIQGTCHIAIGANYMFGGKNHSPVHFDFVAKTFMLERVK